MTMNVLPIQIHKPYDDNHDSITCLSSDECLLLRCVVMTEFLRACGNIEKALTDESVKLVQTGTGVQNESLPFLYGIEDGFDYRGNLFHLLNTMDGIPLRSFPRSAVTIGLMPITQTMQAALVHAVDKVLEDRDMKVTGFPHSPPMYRKNMLTRIQNLLKTATNPLFQK